MIFGINTTRDISKLSQISLVKLRIAISKYHSWYLCQISLQIMLLPIQYFSAQCTSVILQVEKRLKELEKASNTADLLNSFKNLGNDLMDLAKLSGKRQAVSPIMQ